MRLFAIGIKLPNVMTVQCPQDADAREHRRAAGSRHQDQGLHRSLPLRRLVLGLPSRVRPSAGVKRTRSEADAFLDGLERHIRERDGY
jgi:hypothetical protein